MTSPPLRHHSGQPKDVAWPHSNASSLARRRASAYLSTGSSRLVGWSPTSMVRRRAARPVGVVRSAEETSMHTVSIDPIRKVRLRPTVSVPSSRSGKGEPEAAATNGRQGDSRTAGMATNGSSESAEPHSQDPLPPPFFLGWSNLHASPREHLPDFFHSEQTFFFCLFSGAGLEARAARFVNQSSTRRFSSAVS